MSDQKKGRADWYQATLDNDFSNLYSTRSASRFKALIITLTVRGSSPKWPTRQFDEGDL